MKQTMPEFISVLTEGDSHKMDDLFQHKYRKFVRLYNLLKDFSNYISMMRYQETDNSILEIELRIEVIDPKVVTKMLNERITNTLTSALYSWNDAPVLIWREKKIIHVEITKDETECVE